MSFRCAGGQISMFSVIFMQSFPGSSFIAIYCSDMTALPIKLLAMTEIEEFTKCQNIPLDKEDIFWFEFKSTTEKKNFLFFQLTHFLGQPFWVSEINRLHSAWIAKPPPSF